MIEEYEVDVISGVIIEIPSDILGSHENNIIVYAHESQKKWVEV